MIIIIMRIIHVIITKRLFKEGNTKSYIYKNVHVNDDHSKNFRICIQTVGSNCTFFFALISKHIFIKALLNSSIS